mgnify:CR=1 FL=1
MQTLRSIQECIKEWRDADYSRQRGTGVAEHEVISYDEQIRTTRGDTYLAGDLQRSHGSSPAFLNRVRPAPPTRSLNSSVNRHSPYTVQLTLARRADEKRRVIEAEMQNFQKYSRYAAQRNEDIRRRFAADADHLQTLKDKELIDREYQRQVQRVRELAPAVVPKNDVDDTVPEDNEVLRLNLEKAKQVFMESFSEQHRKHEQRVSSQYDTGMPVSSLTLIIICVFQLEQWKEDLVKKLQHQAADSQERLVCMIDCS